MSAAILNVEAVAGDGNAGIQAVFRERLRPGEALAVIRFDVLE